MHKRLLAPWIFLTISWLVVIPASAAFFAPRKSLAGHVPGVVAVLQANGRLAGESRLNLAIGLPLRNQQTLSNLLQAIYDPASPQYRHYLTPEQFTENFGPTLADYQAVIDFAKTNGFKIVATHSDRLLLDVEAAATDIERTFQVKMRLYPHPTEARSFFAPDVEPSVASDLAVADISGLNNYLRPHPISLKRTPLALSPKNTSMDGSGPNGNFIGPDYRLAYVPGTALTGVNQLIGLFEYDNYYPNDITDYESLANITDPPAVQALYVNGYNGAQGDGNGEVALDIEMAMSMAPALTKIIAYEAGDRTPANDLLSDMATNTAISQFSCSWSFGSNPRTTMDRLFQKFAAQGQSFFCASGDSGAYTGALPEPDDDPYITLVGGTTLLTSSPGGSWSGEVTWNAPDIGDASSGGISTSYAIPTWQVGVATASNQASSTFRNVPDVAAVADNIFIVADNGEEESSGGTSAASPLWAAFTALANQQALASGNSTVGFINPALYALYDSTSYLANFDDITFGNNTNSSSPGKFFAAPGYDLCTGLGSPEGVSLIVALAAPDGLVIAPGRGFTANGPGGGPFDVSSGILTLTNSNAAALNWSLGGVPSWLNVSPLSGTIPGKTSANITVSLNSFANTLASNVYIVNLSITNLSSGLAQPREFTLRVDQNLVHDGGFEAGDFSYWTLTGSDAPNYNFVDSGYYTGYTPHSGLYFATFGEPSTLAYISQPLPTRAGQPYLISCWVENPSGDTPNQFVVETTTSTATNTLYNQSNLSAFDWENMQFSFVGSSNATLLQFGFRNDNDYINLDDVSVSPVATPAIQGIQQTADSVIISFSAVPGLTYQVQYTTNLIQPTWINLGSPITATSTLATAAEVIGAGAQEFYRVVLEL